MPKFLIISILLSPIFWACACASTDSCAEEWYGPTDRETMDQKNAKCVNQEKYDSCLSRHSNSQNPDVVAQCREEAMYLCKDRKKH
ncbi:MAG: hypothetical protein IJM92_03820 [Fibrobacter sp.]|uniref:hypothetical protein n=1 Tax=Fibrobacter sp. TaxID=35828 RepID=UPI0025BFB3A0|nr:hypothetical protein [Fibrobacter sp.]MBQ7078792.1 hypothetical protein [Fibrobacter sp.]